MLCTEREVDGGGDAHGRDVEAPLAAGGGTGSRRPAVPGDSILEVTGPS